MEGELSWGEKNLFLSASSYCSLSRLAHVLPKDKKVKEMLAALKNGDRVCTIGGIYGTITSIKDDTIELSVGRDNVKLVFARWAIRNVEEVAIENDSEVLN